MAHMRGKYYLWEDSHRMHIWVADGYDGWDISVWATEDTDGEEVIRKTGYEQASGTSIPMDVMDAFVMMRLAQIMHQGLVDEAIDEALRRAGNVGAMVLERNAETLRAALKQIRLEEPDPL